MQKALPIQRVLLAFLTVLIFSPPALSAKRSSTEQYLQELHAAGKERVIVRFNNQPDKRMIARYNAKLIRELKIINAIVCEIDQTAIESLKRQPNVKYVIPDAVIRIPEPIEREAPPQIIAPMSYPGPVTVRWNNLEAGLNSKAAWDNYNLDGTGIKIAFLDTGINYTLPDLVNNYLGGYDYASDPPDDDPITTDPDEYHGTEVVSIAVGEGVSKIVGVAYYSKFYVVRVSDGTVVLLSALLAGIQWASDEPHKADIISMSLGHTGVGPLWDYYGPLIEQACNTAYNDGIIIVDGS